MRPTLVRTTVLLAAWGCTTPADPNMNVNLLTTRLSVSRATLGPSDTAIVTITSINATSLTVLVRSSCTAPVFRVFQDTQRVDGGFCGIPEASETRMAPGDSIVGHSRFAVLRYVGGGQYRPLDPGTYALIGGWDIQGNLEAMSAPITVQITP
jgi:hypothetical protein